MPHVIALGVLGAGLYAGYRWLTRALAAQAQRAEEEVRQEASGRIEKNLGALEYDPGSGVYRPVRNP